MSASSASSSAEQEEFERLAGSADPEESVEDRFAREQDNARDELDPANIVVIGNTGVGKSFLINALLREPIAKTGVGRPVTDRITRYELPELPIRIYDTPGLELAQHREKLVSDVGTLIEESHTGEPRDLIHLVWFCFNGQGTRFQDPERATVETLSKDLPVILVATQVVDPNDQGQLLPLLDHVAADELDVVERRVVLTLATPMPVGDKIAQPHGLGDLVELTLLSLPEASKRAFGNAVRATGELVEIKKSLARKPIVAASAAAGVVGASPVPFSDAVALVPIQLAMMAKINAIFGIKFDQSELATLAKSSLAAGATTFMGKWLVAQAAKLIPWAGDAAAAAVAAALTYALGEAYMFMCGEIVRARAEGRSLSMEEAARILIQDGSEEARSNNDKKR